mgnify:CR=1 FL=1
MLSRKTLSVSLLPDLLFLAVVIALGWIGYNYYMSQKTEKAAEVPQAEATQPAEAAAPASETCKDS